MNRLEEWMAAAAASLGVQDAADTQLLLDVARDVAHGVVRPAAPLTTYLLGVAVGRGADPAEAASIVTELSKGWPAAE